MYRQKRLRIVSVLKVLMRELLIAAADRAIRYLEGLNASGGQKRVERRELA
jgi:hypothetical protein